MMQFAYGVVLGLLGAMVGAAIGAAVMCREARRQGHREAVEERQEEEVARAKTANCGFSDGESGTVEEDGRTAPVPKRRVTMWE